MLLTEQLVGLMQHVAAANSGDTDEGMDPHMADFPAFADMGDVVEEEDDEDEEGDEEDDEHGDDMDGDHEGDEEGGDQVGRGCQNTG